MKRLLKCFSLAAAALVLFAGCNNLGVNDATVSGLGASEGVKEGYCALALNLDGFIDSAERSAARTINPITLEPNEDPTKTNFNLIDHYVLKGTSSTGATLGEDGAGITVNNNNKAKATDGTDLKDSKGNQVYTVEIPYGSWELILEAYDANNKLLLKGKSFKELKTSKQTIQFILKTDGVTTEGYVNLAGTFVDSGKEAKSYVAGLYDAKGNLIENTLVKKTVIDTDDDEDSYVPGFTYNPKYPAGSSTSVALAPGSYSFKINFYGIENVDDIDENSTVVGYFEDDDVVVAPGRTTTDLAIACGKIIRQRPNSPTNLRAYLLDNSDDADGYQVKLTWNDKSNNEENFVIYLDEYEVDADGNETRLKTTVLGVKNADYDENTKTVKEKFFESDYYVSSPVRIGQTSSKEAVIKLPYNKIFDVSIRAQNFIGESKYSDTVDACARVTTAPVTDPTEPNVTAEPAAPSNAEQYTTTRINRLAINYDLGANGVLVLRSGTGESATTKTVAEYYTDYKNIYAIGEADRVLSKSLLKIDNGDNTKNNLTQDGYAFEKWVNSNGTSFTGDPVLTYKGLDVKAKYDTDTLISGDISDTYYKINTMVKYGDSDVAITDKTATVNDATGNEPIKLTVTVVDNEGNAVSDKRIQWVQVSIRGDNNNNINTGRERFNEGETAEVTLTKKQIESLGASNTIIVKAGISGENNKQYSFTFTLELGR